MSSYIAHFLMVGPEEKEVKQLMIGSNLFLVGSICSFKLIFNRTCDVISEVKRGCYF